MSTPLNTFPAPLLRLILCGGKGLAPAWGPLHHVGTHEADVYPWDPTTQRAAGLPDHLYDDGAKIECWSFLLDDPSPWSARLALVAAWMILPPDQRDLAVKRGAAFCAMCRPGLHLYIWLGSFGSITYGWRHGDPLAACSWGLLPEVNAPNLPLYLASHPPAVALLLALYDVPEIRARVETP